MNYQKINRLLGWAVFAISAIVYLLTIEPTASFWDCGEFISTGYKLEVGHPPGAPFFMLMVNIASQFAFGNVEKVAMMVNAMSGICSAFTILFLFWTITYLAKKMVGVKDQMTTGQMLAIMGSGIIGSLAYTFSDTFWFSAVEGEVYASSSMLTAFVFWAILKWEEQSDTKYSNRWLVLIAYVIGLSIGVHLLNLLAIPAIALVIYFKKYEPTTKGFIVTLLISCVILASVMWGIIPGLVKIGFVFDRIFVNTLGFGFNSGLLFFVVAVLVAMGWGVVKTHKLGKPLANIALLCVAMLILGYCSYAVTVVRSLATPPIDQNDPEDAYSLLSYLNREQYGSNPLIYGQYYNAPLDNQNPYGDNGYTWLQKKTADGKDVYVKGTEKIEYNYDPKMCTFFPRMWSSQPHHVEQYKYWGQIKGRKVKVINNQGEQETIVKPTFGENLRYFFRYQVGFMYMRYFMWNFVGRQNDIQGDGDSMSGNWISGIKFIDEMRLGKQDNLPSEYANNPGTNKYYFLPLLLGLLGLVYQLKRDKKNFWVVMSLFILTGLAIVVYLNQYPNQPRERDYAYAGSFYAFTIWIGFGVLAIYEFLTEKKIGQVPAAVAATVVCTIVPGIMCAQNWDDHDRSNRYVARDVARNYLNSCEPNAIIFTNGDNDTFPLWYAQEVEGVRTDVRVICLPYLITDWYIDQMKSKYYESEPVPFSLTHDKYETGNRDQLYIFERIATAGRENVYTELKDVVDYVASDDEKTKLRTHTSSLTDYIPTKNLKMTISPELRRKLVKNGTVNPKFANQIVDTMKWKLSSRYMLKNDFMILDLIASGNWDRPIYFVSPGQGNDTGIRSYFQCDGFAYKLVPVNSPYGMHDLGIIDSDKLYKNLMEKFSYGNMGDPKVYLDENIRRTIRIVKLRNTFGRLASTLAQENKIDSAQAVVNRCLEILPDEKIPLDYYDVNLLASMWDSKLNSLAEEMSMRIMTRALNDLKYYMANTRFIAATSSQRQMCMYNAQCVYEVTREHGTTEFLEKVYDVFTQMQAVYQGNVSFK